MIHFQNPRCAFCIYKEKKQTNNKQTFSSDSDFHTDYWLTRQRWCFTVIDFCSLRRLAVRENRQSSESWHLFSWSFSLTADDSFISKALSSNLAILLGSLTKTFFIKKKKDADLTPTRIDASCTMTILHYYYYYLKNFNSWKYHYRFTWAVFTFLWTWTFFLNFLAT